MLDTRRRIVRLVFATLAAPLALAACSSEEAGTANGEPIAEVAAPAGSSWSQQAVRTEAGGWQVGNPDAPIKLVEYGSLTCPACANFSMQSKGPLFDTYVNSGRVSFELRSTILTGVLDLLLTRMIECAPVNVAVPLADQVWGNLEAVTAPFSANQAALEQAFELPEDQRFVAMAQAGGIVDFFAARGISGEQAQVCLADAPAIMALAETTQAAATEDGVTGTPTFFLNGVRIDGTSWSVVEPALQEAGAR